MKFKIDADRSQFNLADRIRRPVCGNMGSQRNLVIRRIGVQTK